MNNLKEALHRRAQELDTALPKLMQHYAMERFLYRLSLSPVAGKFYLKGGMLLMGMGAKRHAPPWTSTFWGAFPTHRTAC